MCTQVLLQSFDDVLQIMYCPLLALIGSVLVLLKPHDHDDRMSMLSVPDKKCTSAPQTTCNRIVCQTEST